MAVTIELFGVPRMKVGRPTVEVEAGTLGEALAAVAAAYPALEDEVISEGRLLPAYIVSVNAGRFVRDPALRLAPGDCVLLLSAMAGG